MTSKLAGNFSTRVNGGQLIGPELLSRYGHEISRLTEAQSLAKRGFEVARRGNAAPAVMEDLKVGVHHSHLAHTLLTVALELSVNIG